MVWAEVLSATGSAVGAPEFLGVPTQDQLSATANHPVLPARLGAETGEYLTVSGVGSYSRYLVYSQPSAGGSGEIAVAAVPMDSYDATLGHLLLLELLVGAGVVVLLVLATWLIVRRGLRPLDRMGQTARAIAAGGLGRRVSPAELDHRGGPAGHWPSTPCSISSRPPSASVPPWSSGCASSSPTPPTSCAPR